MEIRNDPSVHYNCAQAVMMAYAPEIGMTEEAAKGVAVNFGSGMKCGKTCGAITAGLMVLGTKGIESPLIISKFMRMAAEKHEGLTDCADLLKLNAENGGDKKSHCDGMVCEAIEAVDEILKTLDIGQ